MFLSRAAEDTDDTPRARAYEVTAAKFGVHVRSLRRLRGTTQEGLAEESDLSIDTIRRIESGGFSPTLGTLCKLCRGLEVSLSTLFAGLERPGRSRALELADFLSGRAAKDSELAWRVIRALFDE